MSGKFLQCLFQGSLVSETTCSLGFELSLPRVRFDVLFGRIVHTDLAARLCSQVGVGASSVRCAAPAPPDIRVDTDCAFRDVKAGEGLHDVSGSL